MEVHDDDWWIRKFESYGFKYDDGLTQQVRQWALDERYDRSIPKAPVPHRKALGGAGGAGYRAVHIILSMKVFINPVVASLPQHAHLFAEDGCFKKFNGTIINKPCGT